MEGEVRRMKKKLKLKVYGITELAAASGVSAEQIRQWVFYKDERLPEPTERLARGAVWIAADVEGWLREYGR